MLLEIDHHSGVAIYRQIVDQIRGLIMGGQLEEGRQLVSVRELAGQVKVNPMTVSKAYSLLEIDGMVDRRRGVGVFVAKIGSGKKNKTKQQMLKEVLKKAAVTAVGLGISEKETRELFSKLYRESNSMRRR